jgi:hypothetical protein
MDPVLAVIVLAPTARPVATPVVLTDATLVFEELHSTELVRLLELPSLNFPVAVNCWLDPTPIDIDAGVTASEVSVGGFPPELELDLPPQAIRVANKSVRIKAYVSFTNFSNADVCRNQDDDGAESGGWMLCFRRIQRGRLFQQLSVQVSVCRSRE